MSSPDQFYDPAELDLLTNTYSPKWYADNGATELALDMNRVRSELTWAWRAASGDEKAALEETLHTMRIRDVEMELAEYKEAAILQYSNPEGSWVYRAYVQNKEDYLVHLREEWGMTDYSDAAIPSVPTLEEPAASYYYEKTAYDEIPPVPTLDEPVAGTSSSYEKVASETKSDETVSWSPDTGFENIKTSDISDYK